MYQLALKLNKSVGDEPTSAKRQAMFKDYGTKVKGRVLIPLITQPELSALMGYEGTDDQSYPNFRRARSQSAHAHGGMILYITDALQEYLQMEKTLKKLPEFMRMKDLEKVKSMVYLRHSNM